MSEAQRDHLIAVDVDRPIWDHFFMVAPLVVVGTLEADGQPDLAPKHMAMPMGHTRPHLLLHLPAGILCRHPGASREPHFHHE